MLARLGVAEGEAGHLSRRRFSEGGLLCYYAGLLTQRVGIIPNTGPMFNKNLTFFNHGFNGFSRIITTDGNWSYVVFSRGETKIFLIDE
jgi:hypothetical protein